MPLHNPLDGSLLDDRSPSITYHINDSYGEKMRIEIWKPITIYPSFIQNCNMVPVVIFQGGSAPSWDHVYEGGGHQLPQWHQLYGEKHVALWLWWWLSMMVVVLVSIFDGDNVEQLNQWHQPDLSVWWQYFCWCFFSWSHNNHIVITSSTVVWSTAICIIIWPVHTSYQKVWSQCFDESYHIRIITLYQQFLGDHGSFYHHMR